MKSRIGRRVVTLFILSALVPLVLCTAFLLREFDLELTSTQEHKLDGLVRSFGMTLLGRLGSADDVLQVMVTAAGASDLLITEDVAKLLWVRSVRRIEPVQALQGSEPFLPSPDARQQRAVRSGASALLWGLGEDASVQVYIVRALPSGAWLYTELKSTWLWTGAGEFAAESGLLALDPEGQVLASAGELPKEALRMRSGTEALPARWMSRSWEVFLGSRFASPSWRLVAVGLHPTLLTASHGSYLYLFLFILLTIVLIAWLSMTTIRRQLRPLGLLTHATKRIAQRDFDGFGEITWDDEFGDLARSFSAMSARLKMQFSALETLSDVDRMLLHTPKLEIILETLLPRMAEVLRCDSVSVLLFDPDSDEHARAYDYYACETGQLPVRRIATDVAALRKLCEDPSLPFIDASLAAELPYFAAASQRLKTIRLHALRHDGRCAGVLCVGYAGEAAGLQDSGVGANDFADRLSLILANLRQSESLHRQANFDTLTGLQNRHLFSDRVRDAVAGAEQSGGLGSVLYLDLDHFKRVNDTAGHSAGDELLRVVAERLAECLGEGQSIGRLGGDEFAVLLPSISSPDVARQVAERMLANLQRPIIVDGREHVVSASIGMSVFPADGGRLEELLKTSDIAMYQAKDAGRGRAVFFQPEMQRKLLERLALESGMHRAMQRHDFMLHYQPIVSEAADGTLGVEALVRWPGLDQAPWIAPAIFVPVAEENGLIIQLGEWVLRSACGQLAQWRSEGVRVDYVSVNVSVRQLREPGFIATLDAALQDSGLHGQDLQLEITESVLAHGAELEQTLRTIAAQGVRVALDDFGTGYSSLSYLRAYPIHTVKIDRSFVQGLPRDPAACRLAESIIVMCGVLGKRVVAEGVETEAQQQFLRRAGCTTIQGYLVARPMDAAEVPAFVRRLRSAAYPAAPAAISA